MNIDLYKTQQYLDWLKEKLYLNAIASNAQRRNILRGQVYRCKLGTGIGSEECKERPCVILQYNSANRSSSNTIVAPITHTSSHLPVVIPIANKYDASGTLILDGNVLLGNIVCVSKARLGDYVVNLSSDEMKKIDQAIAMSLGIKHHYDTLLNQYNDKLQYIEKLKTIRADNEAKLSDLENLLHQHGFTDLDELSQYLKKAKKS